MASLTERISTAGILINNKDLYILMADDDKTRSELRTMYSRLEEEVRGHQAALTDEIMNRMAYGSALKSHKVDPFIAGGAGQAIGGIGGGLYAATSAASRNAQIDEARRQTAEKVRYSSMKSAGSEGRFLYALETLEDELNSIPAIRENILAEKEAKYQNAKSCMASISTCEEAAKMFDQLGGYKDSERLKEASIRKKAGHSNTIALVTSLVIALVLAILAATQTQPRSQAPLMAITAFAAGFLASYISIKRVQKKK